MTVTGCGREQSRHDPRYCPSIYLKGLRISTKTARITDFSDIISFISVDPYRIRNPYGYGK